MTNTAFWDRIAPKYAKSPIADPGAYEETLTRVRSYLKSTDHVLELGCGTGSTALKLRDGVSAYAASDVSQGMIDIARANPGAEMVDFRVADAALTGHEDLKVQAILAFNLLHLVPDAEASLQDIHAMLPKGGLFISKTPAIGEKWYYRPMVAAMRLIGKAPFVRFLKVAQVDRLIENAGFRIVETGLYPPTTPNRFVVAEKI
ncbi:MAG: class I SAM-dependent methyltransferase [Silicimonas sp.]|nr:class I SAM-dependent methyltransferase [Silicimonas sp.]